MLKRFEVLFVDLTDRKKQILKVVVEDYIRTAEPVGSKAIASEMGGSVSSATIRNELADLVELGYLEQPHTSAGRIPSPKGYRLYVNELMERQRLSIAESEKINQSLQIKMEELDRVISQAGRAVSSFVNYPAYVATAGKGSVTASRFELLPVDEKSCIVVMMMGDNRVKSQLLRMQLKVDRDQMAALVELLNRHFTGISTKEMNQKLMAVSQGITPQLFLLLSQTVNYAVDVLEESNHREFVTAGANQLLKLPEFRDADKAHELMSFLADDKEKPQGLNGGCRVVVRHVGEPGGIGRPGRHCQQGRQHTDCQQPCQNSFFHKSLSFTPPAGLPQAAIWMPWPPGSCRTARPAPQKARRPPASPR